MARGFQMGGTSIIGGDAGASDILLGKTAYVNGEEITGVMPELLNFIDYISEKSDTIIIPEGHHNGQGKIAISAAEQAKIIDSNIKKDITLLGVTGNVEAGVDTSDATVAAGDILSGKTAYGSAGTKITGNIASQAAKTVTPATSAQTAVVASRYCSGNISVAAIPNQTAGGAKSASTSAQTILSAPKWLTSALTINALSQTNLAAANIVKGKTITIKNGSANVWSVAGSNNALRYSSGSGNSSAQDDSRKYFYYYDNSSEWLCWLKVNPGRTPVMALSICGSSFRFRNGNTWYLNSPYGTTTSSNSKNNSIWTFASNSVILPGVNWQTTIYYWIFGY